MANGKFIGLAAEEVERLLLKNGHSIAESGVTNSQKKLARGFARDEQRETAGTKPFSQDEFNKMFPPESPETMHTVGGKKTAEQVVNEKAKKDPNWWMRNTNKRFNERIEKEYGDRIVSTNETAEQAKSRSARSSAYDEAKKTGPSTMDHIIGNNAHYGAAALLGTAGLVNVLSNSKGRQSNSRLYGQ